MKYRNLYKYSTDSAPESLRWPIWLCKIALVFSILAVAFFLVLATFVFLNIIPDSYVIPLIISFTCLLLLSLLASMIAWKKFTEYCRERELSTAVVNRHFDKLDIQRWSKTYVKDPIVSHERAGPTVLVPRDSVRRGPVWLLDEVPKQSRFTVWSKWMRSSRRSPPQDFNNNLAPKRSDATL